MSDDTGMQATLGLLIRLSDDEIKGIKSSLEAATRALSMQQAGENSNYLRQQQVIQTQTEQNIIGTSNSSRGGNDYLKEDSKSGPGSTPSA